MCDRLQGSTSLAYRTTTFTGSNSLRLLPMGITKTILHSRCHQKPWKQWYRRSVRLFMWFHATCIIFDFLFFKLFFFWILNVCFSGFCNFAKSEEVRRGAIRRITKKCITQTLGTCHCEGHEHATKFFHSANKSPWSWLSFDIRFYYPVCNENHNNYGKNKCGSFLWDILYNVHAYRYPDQMPRTLLHAYLVCT